MISSTATLIGAAHALLVHARQEEGGANFYADTVVHRAFLIDLDRAVTVADSDPIDAGDVLIAFKAERLACHQFVNAGPLEQDARLLAWDEARERYAQLLAEYCRQTGLTTRNAEKGLGALWIESMGEFAV